MGIFNKGGDVLDLTLLKKKGLLKINDNRAPEVIDLRPQAASAENSVSSQTQAVSPFDFLDNLAASSASVNSNVSNVESISKGSINGAGSAGDLKSNPDFSSLGVRVENLEYKLERLLEKFSAIEGKIDEL